MVTGPFAAIGLRAQNNATHENIHLALDTPLVQWWSGYATVLPGDQVVYQLEDQIVLLDLPTRRIAMLTRGRSPVVIIPVASAPQPTTINIQKTETQPLP